MYLPTAVAFALAIFVAGNITSLIGYYTPVMVIGTILLSVGAGLMTTFHTHTPAIQWIWYQILFGIGAGLAFQQAYTAIQTILQEKYVATAIVCLSFAQELGGIVALAVSQSIFLNLTVSRLTKIDPNLDRQMIIKQGTVSLPTALHNQYHNAVYQAYTKTIVDVFYVGLACACFTICSVGIKWKSVKVEKNEAGATHDIDKNNEKALRS